MSDKLKALLIDVDGDSNYYDNIMMLSSDLVDWKVIKCVINCIDLIINTDFDLVLLDCKISDEETNLICQRIKSRQNGQFISIFFLSSQSSLEQRLKAYDLGASDFIEKAISSEELYFKLKVCINYHIKRRVLIEGFEHQSIEALKAKFNDDSDMSILLSLYKKCISIKNIKQLGSALSYIIAQFQLSFSLKIQTNSSCYYLKSDFSDFTQIEIDLFDSLKKNTTNVQNLSQKSYFHNCDVELLIHNMPIDELDLYGRLKDLLHLLIGVVNDKNKSLNELSFARNSCDEAILLITQNNAEESLSKLAQLKLLLALPSIAIEDNSDDIEEDFIFF